MTSESQIPPEQRLTEEDAKRLAAEVELLLRAQKALPSALLRAALGQSSIPPAEREKHRGSLEKAYDAEQNMIDAAVKLRMYENEGSALYRKRFATKHARRENYNSLIERMLKKRLALELQNVARRYQDATGLLKEWHASSPEKFMEKFSPERITEVIREEMKRPLPEALEHLSSEERLKRLQEHVNRFTSRLADMHSPENAQRVALEVLKELEPLMNEIPILTDPEHVRAKKAAYTTAADIESLIKQEEQRYRR